MLVRKCDKCGKDIPVVTKEILGRRIEMYDLGKISLNEWNVDLNKLLNCDLCVSCANEISAVLDYELLKIKAEVLSFESARGFVVCPSTLNVG